MSVHHEIKSQLAKLLATEDLVVEHKKCETAQFNVHTRVLTLPMWEKASNVVYDLLVGHEVGHALYTPDEDWTDNYKIPPQFVNVVEDARIEKLMKRRYAGLAKTFYNGYKELSNEDFFCLNGEDISTYNLADRANLYFKIGNYIDLKFNETEQEIINLIASTETFTDVLEASQKLYEYCKQPQKEKEVIEYVDNKNQGTSSSGASDFIDQEEGNNDQSKSTDSQTESSSTPKQSSDEDNEGGEENDPEVKTADSFEEALKNLVGNSEYDNVYVEVPKIDLDKVIIPNSEIHSLCKQTWDSHDSSYETLFSEVDRKYMQFKRSAQKEVNYLVKEFECRKAADSYARASISKTGVLDCSKLHTYKYNEDLFKKVTTLADGKNHGLVFILDWSGSMSAVMEDTIKQLYNLIWFCRKVSIPFEVYAFTSEYPIVKYDHGKANIRDCFYEKREGVFHIGEWFSLMNLLTSKVNSKTLDDQMKNIFRVVEYFRNSVYYTIPSGMSLSGTPLNETLISLYQILPKFKKDNKLQKVHCVILTDGEGHPLNYHREVKRNWEKKPFLGTATIGSNAFLRDRKTGNTYLLSYDAVQLSDILLRNLRDNFTDMNFIGIRILENRDAGYFIRRYCGVYGDIHDKVMNTWKKEKAFSISNSGYQRYFGLSSSTLSQDTTFYVSEDASKSQIKTAFVKSLKSKKMNKRVLSEFIQFVA